MKLSTEMRAKYQGRVGGKMRHGYLDVLLLCDLVDDLENLLVRYQGCLHTEDQNAIQNRLALLDTR